MRDAHVLGACAGVLPQAVRAGAVTVIHTLHHARAILGPALG